MNSSLAENRNAPVQPAERIATIDVLRGFALLGILAVNIQSLGLTSAKYLNPSAQGELQGISYGIWWSTYVFCDSKFMTLFSLLFGAGIVLIWERAKLRGRKSTFLHYRRMFWLTLIGLAHAHLLWYGDILVSYAVCGMIVYWFCGLRARWLIPIGLLMIAVGSSLSLLSGWSIPYWEEADRLELMHEWSPTQDAIEGDLAVYRGSWREQLPHRSATAVFMETFLFAFWGFWRAGGLMLVGMGLYKLQVFQGERALRFYRRAFVLSALCGFSIVIFGVKKLEASNWSFEYSFFIGNQYNYWGSLLVSFAYACALVLIVRAEKLPWLRRSLAAVGRLALTNYLMQTILCTTIFYGHGLGWYGHLNRLQLLGVVVCIWALQMVLSPIYLRSFRYGPFEWIWRSLTYWQLQPMLVRVKPK